MGITIFLRLSQLQNATSLIAVSDDPDKSTCDNLTQFSNTLGPMLCTVPEMVTLWSASQNRKALAGTT